MTPLPEFTLRCHKCGIRAKPGNPACWMCGGVLSAEPPPSSLLGRIMLRVTAIWRRPGKSQQGTCSWLLRLRTYLFEKRASLFNVGVPAGGLICMTAGIHLAGWVLTLLGSDTRSPLLGVEVVPAVGAIAMLTGTCCLMWWEKHLDT